MSRLVHAFIGVNALFLVAVVAGASPAHADEAVTLPQNVEAAVLASYPGARIVESEKDDDGYEVELLTADALCVEVDLSATGEILEVDDDDDDDCEAAAR